MQVHDQNMAGLGGVGSKAMLATNVLSEDLPPFVQEVYREELTVMISKKKGDLQKAGFIFKQGELSIEEIPVENQDKKTEEAPKVVKEYDVIAPIKV